LDKSLREGSTDVKLTEKFFPRAIKVIIKRRGEKTAWRRGEGAGSVGFESTPSPKG